MKLSIFLKMLLGTLMLNTYSIISTPVYADNNVNNINTATNSINLKSTTSTDEDSNYVNVNDETSFVTSLAEHKNIRLTTDVAINYVNARTNKTVTIDMNGHTINVEENFNSAAFSGNFIFKNGPANGYMFTVGRNSILYFSQGASINITTDASAGIYVNENAGLSLFNSSINVYSNNSTGIVSDSLVEPSKGYTTDIQNSDITINGNNSLGIKCNNPNNTSHIFYSKIVSNNDSSSCIDADNVISDCSYIYPEPKNTTIINRKVSTFFGNRPVALQLPLHSSLENIKLYSELSITLQNVNNSNDVMHINLPITWTDNTDYDTEGIYYIDADIDYKYPEIGPFEYADSNSIPIYIKDPDTFDISFLGFIDTFGEDECFVQIDCLKNISEYANDPNAEGALYYSIDNGNTWDKYDDNNYYISENSLSIDYLKYNTKYKFQYIFDNNISSNIITLQVAPSSQYTISGDREFGDLGDNTNNSFDKDEIFISKDSDTESNRNESERFTSSESNSQTYSGNSNYNSNSKHETNKSILSSNSKNQITINNTSIKNETSTKKTDNTKKENNQVNNEKTNNITKEDDQANADAKKTDISTTAPILSKSSAYTLSSNNNVSDESSYTDTKNEHTSSDSENYNLDILSEDVKNDNKRNGNTTANTESTNSSSNNTKLNDETTSKENENNTKFKKKMKAVAAVAGCTATLGSAIYLFIKKGFKF